MVIESFYNNVYKHLMKNFELQNAKEIFQEHAWEFYHVDGRDDHANFDIDFSTNGGRRQEGNKKRRGFFTRAFVDEPPRGFVLNKENISVKLERTVVISA